MSPHKKNGTDGQPIAGGHDIRAVVMSPRYPYYVLGREVGRHLFEGVNEALTILERVLDG